MWKIKNAFLIPEPAKPPMVRAHKFGIPVLMPGQNVWNLNVIASFIYNLEAVKLVPKAVPYPTAMEKILGL